MRRSVIFLQMTTFYYVFLASMVEIACELSEYVAMIEIHIDLDTFPMN